MQRSFSKLSRFSIASLIALSLLLASPVAMHGQTETANSTETTPPKETEIPTASVGARGIVKDVILPGTELMAKPLEGDPAMIVQVVKVIPFGDAFRYELRFSGLEPGDYDLSQWMIRKDGTETGQLPAVPVKIESLLPPGQIAPNELQSGWLPKLGGYRNVMFSAIVIWSAILLVLIFAGRRKPIDEPDEEVKPKTLADLLQERLRAGLDNRVEPKQYAELERMLFAFWRRKLNLETESPESAMSQIKQHQQAGPLMVQLEQWLHRPNQTGEVDLAGLLEPYRSIGIEELELEPR